MSTRLSVQQVASDKVQGKGSWVKFKRFTVEESRRIRAEAQAQKDIADAHPEDAAAQKAFQEYGEENSRRLITEHVVDWNWVDDAGQPLPLPRNDPGVLDQLLDIELLFLSGLFEAKTDPNG